MSVGPPGGKGMTSLMGLDGYLSCARSAEAAAPTPTRALEAPSKGRLFMPGSMGQETRHEKRRASLPPPLHLPVPSSLRADDDPEARGRAGVNPGRRGVVAVARGV